MNLTQFSIKTRSGFEVLGEYEGNETSGNAVVFSHGFGVTRDSHGMFNELGDVLKDKMLVVRFDYTKVNKVENWTKVYSFSDQSEMLNEVIDFIKTKFDVKDVNLICHSMGCIIPGMKLRSDISKVILLAGPNINLYRSILDYFSKRPDTVINEMGESKIKRANGSFTYVGQEFWNDLRITDPNMIYFKLSKTGKVSFIRALEDEIFTDINYDMIKNVKHLKFIELHGNHNFEKTARDDLKFKVKELLT